MIRIHLGRALLVSAFALWVSAAAQGQINLISSWESASEITAPGGGGWNTNFLNVAGSSTLSISTAAGVTEGSSSLRLDHLGALNGSGGTHFDRTAELDVTDDTHPLFDLFQTVATTPEIFRLEFDVTIDPAFVADFPADTGTFDKFIGLSTWHNDSTGCCNDSGNLKVWGEDELDAIILAGVPNTVHIDIPATSIGLDPASTFFAYGFATNGNWIENQVTSLFFDNMFFRQVDPEDAADINLDNVLDVQDWDQFLLHHSSNFADMMPLPTSEEAFMMGDLDADLDNDFDDFRIFERTWDLVNGAGSFRNTVLPEPSSLSLIVILGVALAGCRRRLTRSATLILLAMSVFTFSSPTAHAQLLYSWETGLEGWDVVDFATAGRNPAIATSTVGATDGSQSIGITHDVDGFSWSMSQSHASGPVYDAFETVASLGPTNFALEFDVTYDTAHIPQGNPPTFLNVAMAMNNDGGWTQNAFDTAFAATNGTTNETVNVSLPLGGGEFNVVSGGFHEMILGFDGDWGITPATIFIDNLRITQTSVPALLTIQVDTATGVTTLLNDSSQSVEFDYYTIDSPGGSLNPMGWNSLDAQNVDAFDGPDGGTVPGDSSLEGWDAGAGFSTNLTEAFLVGSSTMADQASFSLGDAFDTSVNMQDLVFRFRDPADPDRLRDGIVEYVMSVLPGDYNDDGLVSAGDLNLVLANWGADASVTGVPSGWINMQPTGLISAAELNEVLANWGNGSAAPLAVPEPQAALLMGCVLCGLMLRRVKP